MEAIVHDGVRARFSLREDPARPAGWVRLRVVLAAICLTDVYAARGLLPLGGRRVLGHEIVGEVVEADDGSRLRRGERCSVNPLIACGECKPCVASAGGRCGRPRMVGVAVDGGFAEQIVVPEQNLVRVPAHVPDRRAAYVEPVAAALAVTCAPIRREEQGLLLGSGRIADLTLCVARSLGFAVDREPAREGADEYSYDYVVDASGTEASFMRALRYVRPGGLIVLKSRPPSRVPLDVAEAVRNDVGFAAVSYGPFDQAMQLAAELPVDDFLGPVLPLESFDEALDMMREQPLGPKIFLAPAHAASADVR